MQPINIPPQTSLPHIVESINDGIYLTPSKKLLSGSQSGYEIYSFNINEVGDRIVFSLVSDLPLAGRPEPRAKNKVVSYGDLVLYYPNQIIGIRFDGKNNGIYRNVKLVNNASKYFGNRTEAMYKKQLRKVNSLENYLSPPKWITGFSYGDLFSKNVEVTETKLGEKNEITISVKKSELPQMAFKAFVTELCLNDFAMQNYNVIPPTIGENTSETNQGSEISQNSETTGTMAEEGVTPPEPEPMPSELLPIDETIVSDNPNLGWLAGIPLLGGLIALLASNSDGNTTPVVTEPSPVVMESSPMVTNPTPVPSIEPSLVPSIEPNPVPSIEPSPVPSPGFSPPPSSPNPKPSEAVPEPNQLLGLVLAVVLGVFFKMRNKP